ncbi:MAG: CvpA family protein [Anaerolineales bacterium]|nr:CvpA family protein [Anaerolineales bacterium]
MMGLSFAFWLFVALFAIIGGIRGWAKELLVTFSMIVSLFIITVLERYVPPVKVFFEPPNSSQEFWVKFFIVGLLVFFGYQTPNLQRIAGARFVRERLSDTMLGFFLGAINGFLIVSSVWYFMEQSDYPFRQFIIRPEAGNLLSAPALRLLPALAPRWLGAPTIYFAVAVSFLFVLVVFI